MDDTSTPTQDPNVKKSKWKSILDAVQSPMDFLQHWSSKSPLLTVLAVVFLLQPVISTSIDLIDEWRSVKANMDPGTRPVTENELEIVNKKIDFLQQLILQEMNNRLTTHITGTPLSHYQLVDQPNNVSPSPVEPTTPSTDNPKDALKGLQDQLSTVQQKLDADWQKMQEAKK